VSYFIFCKYRLLQNKVPDVLLLFVRLTSFQSIILKLQTVRFGTHLIETRRSTIDKRGSQVKPPHSPTGQVRPAGHQVRPPPLVRLCACPSKPGCQLANPCVGQPIKYSDWRNIGQQITSRLCKFMGGNTVSHPFVFVQTCLYLINNMDAKITRTLNPSHARRSLQ
jgi:hypothetical protein